MIKIGHKVQMYNGIVENAHKYIFHHSFIGLSEKEVIFPVRCSLAVTVAAGGLGTTRIFQIDFFTFA